MITAVKRGHHRSDPLARDFVGQGIRDGSEISNV
jgi:hypothetical protein